MKKLCDLPSGSVITLPTYRIVGSNRRIDSERLVIDQHQFTLRNSKERDGEFMVLYNKKGEPQILARPEMLVELKGGEGDKTA